MLFSAVFLISIVVPTNAKAAPKLSSKMITLKVGQKKKLQVKNRKKKVQWISKKKTVATVNKKGVVKVNKKGKATIIAKVGKKKLKCKVVVKKANSNNKNSDSKDDDSKISKTVKKQLLSDNIYVSFQNPTRMVLGKQMDLFPYVWCAGKAIDTPSNAIKENYGPMSRFSAS